MKPRWLWSDDVIVFLFIVDSYVFEYGGFDAIRGEIGFVLDISMILEDFGQCFSGGYGEIRVTCPVWSVPRIASESCDIASPDLESQAAPCRHDTIPRYHMKTRAAAGIEDAGFENARERISETSAISPACSSADNFQFCTRVAGDDIRIRVAIEIVDTSEVIDLIGDFE